MNHLVWIVFDSARFDVFEAARTPVLDSIAVAESRFSYASWTAPSHFTFLMGLTPHTNRPDTFASVLYREDLGRWSSRLGVPAERLRFDAFVPSLSLPAALKTLGYRCEGYVSLPVLNPHTALSRHFDSYRLMPAHNDLRAIVNALEFGDQPTFCFINTGETHYPYLLPGETDADLPRLSGLHGVFKSLDDFLRNPAHFADPENPSRVFNADRLRALWEKQVANVEYLDGVVGELLERCPENTWLIVTSDHGELFGEDGFFGHGPIMHPLVFRVFFLEGMRP